MPPRTSILSVFRAVAVLTLPASLSQAASVSIGAQHFTNGQTGIGSGIFNTAVAGQPSPFDLFNGGDVSGPDFDATWTFVYSPVAIVVSATLTIGLYDGDFAATGLQLNVLTVDGTSIATLASPIFEAGPGLHAQYGVYTIPLPAGLLPSLADGSATIHMSLAGPGLGVLGETSNNGAGLDFATLDYQWVPEASTGLLTVIAGLALTLRRRRMRHA